MEARFTVAGQIRHFAEARPGAAMLTLAERTLTWSTTYRRAATVAQALRDEQLVLGDRLAFLDRNGVAHFETLYGWPSPGPWTWRSTGGSRR